MQDLVAVGVADAGHERLVLQQVLELARVPPDPLAPDLERQRRVVCVRALLAPPSPGIGAVDPGRRQVDLAHLGRVAVADLGRGASRREPRRAARPGGGIARPSRRAARSPSTTAVLVGCFSPGAASWNRPVSIGLHDDRVAIEVDQRGTCRAGGSTVEALADERLELGRRAADGERSGCLGGARPAGRRAPHGRHRRPRSGRVIRARRRDCSRSKALC